MRTTLKLDDDVAVLLTRARNSRQVSLKEIVNEALRRGIASMMTRSDRHPQLRTKAAPLGCYYSPGIDDASDVLAFSEGERFR
ncbi:MAG: antitoxin [Acidobacteria bacterium]|nr:MAG: antitoxin [Acidobacteriota bacterium]